jgi:hypothetical protein
MSLEFTMDRIALALERIADHMSGPQNVVTGQTVIGPITTALTAEGTPSIEAPKKPARGRPAKITTEEKAAATPAVVVEPKPAADDFLDTPEPVKPVKPATLEDVRKALQVYAGAQGGGAEGVAKARALMTKASSNGAQRLSEAKDVPSGKDGVLLATDYAAVIAAATA